MERQTVLETPYATLWYYPVQRIVHHRIHKYIRSSAFRSLLNEGAGILKEHNATKWLSDDRKNGAISREDSVSGGKAGDRGPLLGPSLVGRYLRVIGVSRRPPGLDALGELVQAHLTHLPFENVSKLLRRKHLGLTGLPVHGGGGGRRARRDERPVELTASVRRRDESMHRAAGSRDGIAR